MDALQPDRGLWTPVYAVRPHLPDVKEWREVLGRFDDAPRGEQAGPGSHLAEQSLAGYQQVRSCGFLEVPSPRVAHRIYRIPGIGGLGTVYEHGCLLMGLCLQTTEPLPLADVVVMHKLLIEANE